MKPLVSILMPAYNAERSIADTLESAVAQTWEPKEIIVVDDGSKDATLAIVQKFAPRGVRVVSQKNQGAAAARNNAFQLSKGDFIQWLDADDLLSRDKIANQISALEGVRNQRTLVSGACGHFRFRPDRADFTPTALWCDLAPLEFLLRKIEQNLFMQTATWLASRELVAAAGPWDTRLLSDDDGEYFCRVVRGSDSIRFVREAKVYYRIGGDGLSYIGRSSRKLEALFLSIELHIQYIRSLEDSPRVRQACLTYLQRHLFYFYPELPEIVERAHWIAADLGGRLETPRLSWKYAWIQKLFGWHAAKRAQLHYNRLKAAGVASLDRALAAVEKPKVISNN
jgi:glycosyltransferase involved in cell wall biosynthesis